MKTKIMEIRFEQIRTVESPVKLLFDLLHGIVVNDVTFVVTLEFAILLGFDGQLKQESLLEMELFASTIKQLMKTKMTKMENALCWLYVKSWNNFGQHVLDEEGLWNFGGEDLEAALMGLAYQRKQDKSERSKELKKLIMERFNNMVDFCEWSRIIHSEVTLITNLYCQSFQMTTKKKTKIYFQNL